jgi:hypothetical protein
MNEKVCADNNFFIIFEFGIPENDILCYKILQTRPEV